MYGKNKIHAKKHNKNEHLDDIFFLTGAASANDCTGITPLVPDSGYEAESYFDIIDVPVTAKDGAEKFKDIP